MQSRLVDQTKTHQIKISDPYHRALGLVRVDSGKSMKELTEKAIEETYGEYLENNHDKPTLLRTK